MGSCCCWIARILYLLVYACLWCLGLGLPLLLTLLLLICFAGDVTVRSRRGSHYTAVPSLVFDVLLVMSLTCLLSVCLTPQSLEKYLHGPMKAKHLTDEIIDQRAAELSKAHHDAQMVCMYCCMHVKKYRVHSQLWYDTSPFSVALPVCLLVLLVWGKAGSAHGGTAQ